MSKAYNRSKFNAERKALLSQWSQYCAGKLQLPADALPSAVSSNRMSSPSQGYSNFVVSIPEPATQALIAIALVGLAFIRRRAMSIV